MLTTAPEMFWPPFRSCSKFCRKDCRLGVVADAPCPCEALLELIKFWKQEFRLLSALLLVEPPVDVLGLLEDSCCSRFSMFAARLEPP